VRLLMSLPGVDFSAAQALLAALGDVTRFASADRAAAYVGLAPSTRQSGERCHHGAITKQGRGHATLDAGAGRPACQRTSWSAGRVLPPDCQEEEP
jgi:transposase